MSGAKDMPDPTHFRQVMAHFTTGVTLVTSRRADGSPCGLTVNAFTSVSLDPVLVLVCLGRSSSTLGAVLERGAFAVSVLDADSAELAFRFSEGEREGRFEELAVRDGGTGCPILESALAWLDCRVRDVHEAGDHHIVVGEVGQCGARQGSPLLFHHGGFRGLLP